MKNRTDRKRRGTMAARAMAAVLAVGLLAGCANGGTTTTAGEGAGNGQTTTAQGSGETTPAGTQPGESTTGGATGETGDLIFAADARRLVMERAGAGFIEEIEYDHDDDRDYEGEVLQEGVEIEFELSAVTGEFTKWEEQSSNDYDQYVPHLETMISIDEAADLVIDRSGLANTFVQEIDLSLDDGLLEYEGDAYNDGVKYDFEIDALTGEFKEWEEESSNDWATKYSNLQ